jgi:mRNA-degrading endonuclease RelE of RelBE toxin-antitoxin system
MYNIKFTSSALVDLRSFRKHEQNIILDAIDVQLIYEPLIDFVATHPISLNGNYELVSFGFSIMLIKMFQL